MFLLLLVYLAVVSPLLALERRWSRELDQKRHLLLRYQGLQEGQVKMVRVQQVLKAATAEVESQFLSGPNAAVAAADLQEILKNLTEAHGVQLTSTKVLSPRETGPYVEVPVQVQLSGTLDQLLTVLYHVEHEKKLLFIPELEINAPRWLARRKQVTTIQMNLVVAGVMPKGTGK